MFIFQLIHEKLGVVREVVYQLSHSFDNQSPVMFFSGKFSVLFLNGG